MRYLSKFNEFNLVNEEWSKNDPIPEITQIKNKLGIVLLGAPGVGKSTFVKNFILPKNQIKTFSTDDVSLMFTKDPNTYKKGSSELNINRLKKFMDSGQSFIYDTTGTQEKNINEVISESKKSGYKIIFIHIVGPLDVSLKQNLQRDRQVDVDYIKYAYDKQFSNIKNYSNLSDGYYIVYSIGGKYKFFKYRNGEMLRRKVDRYVSVNESTSVDNSDIPFYEISDILRDFIEEYGEDKVTIYSVDGRSYKIGDKDRIQSSFRVSKNVMDLKIFGFKVKINLPNVNYYEFSRVMDRMKESIDKFGVYGWSLVNFSVDRKEGLNKLADGSTGVYFDSIEYKFSKPSEDTDKYIEVKDDDIIHSFHQHGLSCDPNDSKYNDINWDGSTVTINYTSCSFDGEYPDPERLHKILSEIAEEIGAYDYTHRGEAIVDFMFDSLDDSGE